ncbi:DMT family transporter [Bradyrhizobium sp. NC92]|uniref:DMT family transporter n=1 Tax=Bradyrhizobium sp. (strain NC92) TaxID=55395 RepID=UPI0021A99A91|nr:DMT family transporter [Bradyrhizobium sp. NC92]UWU68111.1 DMT family transporter [Bradyrhizobium sp. NC92]
MSSPPLFLPLLCGTLATVSWSIGNVLSKAALCCIEPLSLLTGQLAVSAASLTVLSIWSGAPPRLSDWRAGLPGILQPALASGLSIFGLSMLPASVEAMLFAVEPPLIIFLAWFILGELPNRAIIFLCLLAVAGVGFLSWTSDPDPSAARGLGVALVLAGVLFASLYSIVVRVMSKSVDTLRLTTASQIVAFALVAFAWIGFRPLPTLSVSIGDVVPVVGSGLLLLSIPFLLYGIALQRMSATAAALLLPLVPVFTAIFASIFLQETLTATQWLGAAAVLVSALGTPMALRSQPHGSEVSSHSPDGRSLE